LIAFLGKFIANILLEMPTESTSHSRVYSNSRIDSLLAVLIFLTGVFAILGGLYTWGDGLIFSQSDLLEVLIPWADILLTGPLSIICGIGLYSQKKWAFPLGLFISGIYVFGSVLVFISIAWKHDYSWFLILPSFSGLSIGIAYTIRFYFTQMRY
jgi:hypothetical protein